MTTIHLPSRVLDEDAGRRARPEAHPETHSETGTQPRTQPRTGTSRPAGAPLTIIINNRVFKTPSAYMRKQFIEDYPGERALVLGQIDRWAAAQSPITAISGPIEQAAHDFLRLANA
ncbi:hypothetical protein [uncultured Cohaesibacter sp.]|uniref:hypothetical protein n=1 Tax=uncultured Cohaesibacter sp. TaxID=1002546 RepID=UPI0029C848A1|nr:hypothetical protein [uncultured Cohaesibacter sp.]